MDKQKKIIVVDDDPVSRQILSIRLEISDYIVVTAQDGEEALEKIKEENPDLAILDLMMPKINGYEVCRMLNFDDTYKDMPIIVLSSLHEQDERDKAIKSGADACLLKPFDLNLLLAKVKDLIN